MVPRRRAIWGRVRALALLGLLGLWGAPATSPAAERPAARILCRKATAPVELDLVVLEGGLPGERTSVVLAARPHGEGGRLDLDLRIPEGLRVVSGGSSDSTESDGSPRLLQVELELPALGLYQLVGTAKWILPGGQQWSRGVTLDLPLGVARAPEPSLPLTPLPGGGAVIDFSGGGGP